jgi:hypothetical protein
LGIAAETKRRVCPRAATAHIEQRAIPGDAGRPSQAPEAKRRLIDAR